ncbi:MAG TPA: serine/threonine-protein kinase [Gaiellaceae bacterium]|nr:serine/threonine-protein kinase [Gaiellaceae bacterium]
MDGGSFLPGDVVAGYRLVRLLGEGGFGFVFEADAPAGGALALKLLRPELATDPTLRARFGREARLAQRFRSGHVVPIVDVGEHDGVPFLVLPLYSGDSLAARLRRGGPLSSGDAAALAAELGRGLDALHEHGIVHRDVKPSNVLFDAAGAAALSDFGLARAVDSTRLTRDGQLLGTPHYLAPELIEGGEANAASDLYALGCVLYECVVGSPPFAAHRLTELGFAHLTEPVPDPRERRPELPADYALALTTALAKDPAERPTTATALARMLTRSAARG